MQNKLKYAKNLRYFFRKKAKIMGNGLRFASISHGVKKNFSQKGQPTLNI
jgi:hypothetical protein